MFDTYKNQCSKHDQPSFEAGCGSPVKVCPNIRSKLFQNTRQLAPKRITIIFITVPYFRTPIVTLYINRYDH